MNIDGQSYGANGSAAAKSPATATLSSDFNTFLRMLTVQMQNQDPLNPMEASDFAVQLATFSQVEQQVRTNDLLNGLTSQMAVMGMSQLASWVGMEARTSATLARPGAPVELVLTPRSTADSAELVVRDQRGREVQRIPTGPEEQRMSWTGSGLPAGTYSLELISYRSGTILGSSPVEHYAAIREARGRDGAITLVLASGSEVDAGTVSALRSPS